MNESMAELVWSKYQDALTDIDARDAELDRLDAVIHGLRSQARDWKARTRILAKRLREYEEREANTYNAREMLPSGLYEFDGEAWVRVPDTKGADVEREDITNTILDQVRAALQVPDSEDIVQYAAKLRERYDALGWD